MRLEVHSTWNAREAISQRHEIYSSVLAAVVNTQENYYKQFPSQKFRIALEKEFLKESWLKDVCVSTKAPKLHLYRERLAIEIRFADFDYLYSDYLRFLSAYQADKIDAGILITDAETGMKCILNDLEWLGPCLIVPLWIIGLK